MTPEKAPTAPYKSLPPATPRPERPEGGVSFLDGAWVAYNQPRDTLDDRAGDCTNHHVACDCREAMTAEDTAEHRAAMNDARLIIGHLIDAPCPADRRRGCRICEGALTTWLHRYDAVWATRREEAPF